MGQQQLLLLVLGIMIVAIAIVVGIFAFQTNMKKSNADALVSDGVRIANLAQAWKLKPPAMGGQDIELKDDVDNFDGFSLNALAMDEPYATVNGSFTIGDPDRNPDGPTDLSMGLVLVGKNEEYGNTITVTVDGINASDIIVVISSTDVQEGQAED